MSADESEDGSDIMEASEDNEDGEDTFMHRYSDALNEELKDTTLQKSFVRANDHSNKNEVIFSSFLVEMIPYHAFVDGRCFLLSSHQASEKWQSFSLFKSPILTGLSI